MKICIKKAGINILVFLAITLCSSPTASFAGDYTIDNYEFGKIVVSGKTYESDIIILPDGSIKPGPEDIHYVLKNEIEEVMNIPGIETLVIGTGAEGNGMLRKKLLKIVKAKGITVKMMLTEDAMQWLNETPKRGLVAMLHLNC